MKPLKISIAALIVAASCFGQVETAQVIEKPVERTVNLPGEILPYESTAIYARVNGYVDQVLVDRGSLVRKGQLLAILSAPEMKSQVAEAEAKVGTLQSQRAEAEAKAAAAESTYQRMKEASQTPGAVAGNELVIAEKEMAAAKQVVSSFDASIRSAQAAADAVKELLTYLRITAPFEGMITERLVHPGALAGPASGPNSTPLLRLEKVSRLRLVVPVPEVNVGGIVRGARVRFTVPAYPGEQFYGTVARIPNALDTKTRTMPIELDVLNANNKLAPGMYPEVIWPMRRSKPSLLVPASAVVTTTERTFVVRVDHGRATWVDVRKIGSPPGDLVEVTGELRPGEVIVKRATDEIRNGSNIRVKNTT